MNKQEDSPRGGRRNRWLSAAVLGVFALPLLAYWAYAAWINPSKNYYTVDTEFPYFLNSLSVFKGGSYTYSDHPGTPLEETGTGILAVIFARRGGTAADFVTYELQNPGKFLDAAHSLLIVLNIACLIGLFLAARGTRGWDYALAAGGIAVMYFAVHPGSLEASTVWNHNSFSFPLGTALLIALYLTLDRRSGTGDIPAWKLALIGLGAGVLAAIQIYLAAWLAGILTAIAVYCVLRRRPWFQIASAIGITGAAAVGGFYLAVLPIIQKVQVFWNWATSILTNQSKYLAVPEDQAASARLVENLGNFYSILPVLFIATIGLIALTLIGLAVQRNRLSEKPGPWSLASGMVVQTTILSLLFLNHPLRDAYFLSVAATLPILAWALLRAWEFSPRAGAAVRIGFAALAFAGATVTSVQSIAIQRDEAATMRATEAATTHTIQAYATQVGKPAQDLVILWMYGSYAPCWGLRTGDALSANAFAQDLDSICPNQYRLGLNLRFDIHGDDVQLAATNWDMIFTCDKYVGKITDAVTAGQTESFDSIDWGCGSMTVLERGR